MKVEPSKLAQLVIAYHEKFGRHVPEPALRRVDAGRLAALIQDSLATGVPIPEGELGWLKPREFSPRGCCIVDESATSAKLPTGSDAVKQAVSDTFRALNAEGRVVPDALRSERVGRELPENAGRGGERPAGAGVGGSSDADLKRSERVSRTGSADERENPERATPTKGPDGEWLQ